MGVSVQGVVTQAVSVNAKASQSRKNISAGVRVNLPRRRQRRKQKDRCSWQRVAEPDEALGGVDVVCVQVAVTSETVETRGAPG